MRDRENDHYVDPDRYDKWILICPSNRLKRQALAQGINSRIELVEFNAIPKRFESLHVVN